MEQSLFHKRKQALALRWTLEVRERRGVEGDTSVSIVGDRRIGAARQDNRMQGWRGEERQRRPVVAATWGELAGSLSS